MTTATLTADERTTLASAMMPFATFSVTGGLAADYVKRGEMIPWQGILAVEGIETGDGRIIAPEALVWRELPLPLMFQFENPVGGEGHDGATLTSRIDDIVRIDAGRIWARGFIDPTMPDGETMVMAMDKGLIRGVSVDLDKVSQVEIEGSDGKMRTVITSARIAGATVCPFQAFMEATVQLDAELMAMLDAEEALVASAATEFEGNRARVWLPVDAIETILVDQVLAEAEAIVASASAASPSQPIPLEPPSDWFAYDDSITELVPFTITANGRMFGHIAAWGTCHISFSNKCVPVPRSATKYSKFRCGSVLTAEGNTIRTGPIVMDTIHPDLRWRAKDAQTFYANTGAAMADVVPHEDQFGIYIAGAVRPDVSPARLRALRGSDMSPDWRLIDGNPHEMCAILAVNNSGFKVPLALTASAGLYVLPGQTAFAMDEFDEVYALVASGPLSMADSKCEKCAAHEHSDDEDCGCELEVEDSVEASIVADAGGTVVVVDRPELDVDAFVEQFGVKPLRTFRRATPMPKPRTFKRASS